MHTYTPAFITTVSKNSNLLLISFVSKNSPSALHRKLLMGSFNTLDQWLAIFSVTLSYLLPSCVSFSLITNPMTLIHRYIQPLYGKDTQFCLCPTAVSNWFSFIPIWPFLTEEYVSGPMEKRTHKYNIKWYSLLTEKGWPITENTLGCFSSSKLKIKY